MYLHTEACNLIFKKSFNTSQCIVNNVIHGFNLNRKQEKRTFQNKISIPVGCEIFYPEIHGTDRILYRFKATINWAIDLQSDVQLETIKCWSRRSKLFSEKFKKKWSHEFKNWSENFKEFSALFISLSYLSQQNTSCCHVIDSDIVLFVFDPIFRDIKVLFMAWKKTRFCSAVQDKSIYCQQGWYDERNMNWLFLLLDSNLVNSQTTETFCTNIVPGSDNIIPIASRKCPTIIMKSLSMKQRKVQNKDLGSISQASGKQFQRNESTGNVKESLYESNSEVQERNWDKAWRREEDIHHNVVSQRQDVKSSDDLSGNHESTGIKLTLSGIKHGFIIAEQLRPEFMQNMFVADMVKKDRQSEFAFGLSESDTSYPYYLGLVIDRSNDLLGVSNTRQNQQVLYFETVYYSSFPSEIDGYQWHEFARESLREATFESYTNFDKGLAEQLSRMGFFYTGELHRGTMFCYYCRVGIQSWQPEDGINVLHTVHLSRCQMRTGPPSAAAEGVFLMDRNQEMMEEGAQGSCHKAAVAMATAGGEQSDMEMEDTVTQSHSPQQFIHGHQLTASAATTSIGFLTPLDDSITIGLALPDTGINDPASSHSLPHAPDLSTPRLSVSSHSDAGSALSQSPNIEVDSESTGDSSPLSGWDDSNLTAPKGLASGATPSTSLTALSSLVDANNMAMGSGMSYNYQDARHSRSTTAHIRSSGTVGAGNMSLADANPRGQGQRSHHLSVNSQIYSIPTQAASAHTTTSSIATSSMLSSVSSVEPSNRPLTYQDLGIIYGKPKDPGFALLSNRLDSFKPWPENHSQRPDSLARAGFYYVGHLDSCKCFYCGGGLRNWEQDDDPHVEHARWYPHCVYIIQSMGNDFVHVVQDMSQQHQGRPRNNRAIPMGEVEREMERRHTKIVNYFEDGPVREDPAVKAVIEGGFDEELVLSVARKLRAETSALSADQIVQNIALYRPSSTKGSAADNTANDAVHGEVGGAVDDAEAGEGAVGGAMAIGGVESSSTSTQNMAKELESLKGENYSLRNRFLCKICMDREVRIVFLPCGHFITCMECSVAILDCPLCRQHIRATVRANIR